MRTGSAACARPAGKGRVGYLNYPFTSFDILSFYILEMIPLYYIFLHPRVVTGSLKDPGSRLHRSASHIAGRSPDVNSNAPRIPPGRDTGAAVHVSSKMIPAIKFLSVQNLEAMLLSDCAVLLLIAWLLCLVSLFGWLACLLAGWLAC